MADAAAISFDNARFTDFLTVMRRISPGNLTAGQHDPGAEIENLSVLNILVVGAGGIGCELLHAISVSPLMYCNFWVIDMDTIDLSNLNRQFLFRTEHIGKSKAQVAVEETKKRNPSMKITAIHDRIENLGADFYRSMHFILLGLDSVPARQWMNSTICTLFAEEVAKVGGDASQAMPIQMIDGGTEAYKGSVRRIVVQQTPCIECMMYQFPPAKGVPMCTLENIPRNAAHCVLYAVEKFFKDELPFGPQHTKPDGDDEKHITWIMERAQKRQQQFKIEGTIDFQFTQGVTKNVVPAVGFSNALVAATMVNETLKIFTQFGPSSQPQIQYDGSCVMGVGSTTPFTMQDPDCLECSARPSASISISKPFSSLTQVAWDALRKASDAKYRDAPIPSRCKATARVNLMPFTVYPEDHAACLPSAKADSNQTVGQAELRLKNGSCIPVVANETVFTVELTILEKSKGEKEAEEKAKSMTSADAAVSPEKDSVDDVCGRKRAYVMVLVTE